MLRKNEKGGKENSKLAGQKTILLTTMINVMLMLPKFFPTSKEGWTCLLGLPKYTSRRLEIMTPTSLR